MREAFRLAWEAFRLARQHQRQHPTEAFGQVRVRLEPRDGPPGRFCMMGRWYNLASLGGPAWQHGCDPDDPLVFTYTPEEPR